MTAIRDALRAIIDTLDAEEMGEGPPASEHVAHWQKLHDDGTAALDAETPVTPATVSRETFAYYLSEAENGWCKIPRRVADDMDLYCANLEAKLAEARKVIEAGDLLAVQTRSYQRGNSGTTPLGIALNNWDRSARRFLEETK